MRWFSRFLQRRQAEQRLDAELRFHLETQAEDLVSAGLTPEEARRQARLRFGGLDAAKERCRDVGASRLLETTLRDARYGWRQMRRHPGTTAVIVLTLALGIGANAAIFSLVDAVLLRTLPVPYPNQIVLLGQTDGSQRFPLLSYPVVRQFAQAAGQSARVGAASATADLPLGTADGSSGRVGVQLVTGGYFAALDLHPLRGRWIGPADNRALGASPVAVVSERFWRQHFHGAGDVAGRDLRIDGVTLTVVGVAPRGFQGLDPAHEADVWAPVMMQPALHIRGDDMNVDANAGGPWPPQEGISWLHAFARVPDASALPALQGRFQLLLQQSWKRIAPSFTPWRLTLAPGGRGAGGLRSRYGSPLRFLMALAALMLVIAILNVATLLLARTLRRRHEIAIRLVVGVSRRRLARQLLTEALLIAAVGGGLAALVLVWLSRILVHLAAAPFHPALAWPVWALLALITLAAGLLFGLLPAWQSTRANISAELSAQSGRSVGGGHMPLGRSLIVGQVALSLLLVAGAGLFARNLVRMFAIDFGFNPNHLLTVDLSRTGAKPSAAQRNAFDRQLLAKVRALPGVSAAALDLNGIDTGSAESGEIFAARAAGSTRQQDSQEDTVSRDYFRTVGMRLLRGRGFEATDTANSPSVVVVNQAFARTIFPGQKVLGATFGYDPRHTGQFRIVGVAADARTVDPHAAAVPMFFHLADQYDKFPLRLEVRTQGSSLALAGAVRRLIARGYPDLHVHRISSARERLARLLRRDRLLAQLSGGFGVLALLLACLGVYGVLAHAVAARRGEFAVRMALGASPGGILLSVVREAAITLGIGAICGLTLALWAGRAIQPLLTAVGAADPLTLAAATLAITVLPLAAALLPASRAARTDPAETLRA